MAKVVYTAPWLLAHKDKFWWTTLAGLFLIEKTTGQLFVLVSSDAQGLTYEVGGQYWDDVCSTTIKN